MTHDHAYWVSGLKLSDKAPSGTVDAIALPLSYKLPKSASLLRGTFTDPVRGWNAYVDWLAYNQDLGGHGLQDFEKTWQPDPDVTVTPVKVTQPPGAGSNGFTATLTSLSAETLDLDRMSESLSQNVVGDVKTSTATTATFVSRYLTGVREVIVDGTPQFVAARNGQLSVSLTPGRHTVVIVVSGGAKAVTAAPPATRARASWASPRHAVAVQLDRFVSSLTAPLIAVGLIVLLTAAGGAVLAARARPRT